MHKLIVTLKPKHWDSLDIADNLSAMANSVYFLKKTGRLMIDTRLLNENSIDIINEEITMFATEIAKDNVIPIYIGIHAANKIISVTITPAKQSRS